MMIEMKDLEKKFSDADLIGIPFQIIVGNNLKSNNEVSIIDRLK